MHKKGRASAECSLVQCEECSPNKDIPIDHHHHHGSIKSHGWYDILTTIQEMDRGLSLLWHRGGKIRMESWFRMNGQGKALTVKNEVYELQSSLPKQAQRTCASKFCKVLGPILVAQSPPFTVRMLNTELIVANNQPPCI